jgi:hypothetical protein
MTIPRVQPVPTVRPHLDAAPAPEGPFVINLCSSTTPVALSQPQDPELKRFSFFVSRRLEDGRERFRLHMGFFETLPDAEEWLTLVREVYPGAWAGEAPGKRLRGKPAAPLAQPAPAPAAVRASPLALAPPAQPAAPKPQAAPRPQAAPKPQAARPQPPTLFPAPAAAAGTPRPSSTPRASGRPAAPQSAAAPAAAPASAVRAAARGARTPMPAASGSSQKPAAAQPVAPRAAAANARGVNTAARTPQIPGAASGAPLKGAPAAAKAHKSSTLAQLPFSNVREVLASLDETGSTQQMPALDKMPSFENTAPNPQPGLSDSQVLKILENRRPENESATDDGSISLLKPDDTGTRRELREAITSNAPVSFAVQLHWSVQPIEIAKVPPLAIFSAYTLYTVEGSREGRRWYGLRLGFFGDAISARQVAQYVRSEFASVAVVPVGAQERSRASTSQRTEKVKSAASTAPLRDKLPDTEFKLIEDAAPPVPVAPLTAAAKEKGPQKAQAGAPQKRPARGTGRVRAREKRSPHTLEETLEILGADQLEIEDRRGDPLNDSGVRHLKVEVRKQSPFTKLLDRLAERARKTR